MSKIELHNGLMVARKVIKELEKILPKHIAKECRIESWSNCREQGLCLKNYYHAMSFCIAEHRSSDNILVIHGNSCDFDFQTNQPNQTIWETNKLFFVYNEHKKAAKSILDILSK